MLNFQLKNTFGRENKRSPFILHPYCNVISIYFKYLFNILIISKLSIWGVK